MFENDITHFVRLWMVSWLFRPPLKILFPKPNKELRIDLFSIEVLSRPSHSKRNTINGLKYLSEFCIQLQILPRLYYRAELSISKKFNSQLGSRKNVINYHFVLDCSDLRMKETFRKWQIKIFCVFESNYCNCALLYCSWANEEEKETKNRTLSFKLNENWA